MASWNEIKGVLCGIVRRDFINIRIDEGELVVLHSWRREALMQNVLYSSAPGVDPDGCIVAIVRIDTAESIWDAAATVEALMEQTVMPRRIVILVPAGADVPASLRLLEKRGLEIVTDPAMLPADGVEIPVLPIPAPDMLENLESLGENA